MKSKKAKKYDDIIFLLNRMVKSRLFRPSTLKGIKELRSRFRKMQKDK